MGKKSGTVPWLKLAVSFSAVLLVLLLVVLFVPEHHVSAPSFSEDGEFLLTREEMIKHFQASKWSLPVHEISRMEDFFDYITKPAAQCESVVVMGGRKCHEFDDHVVCLEQTLGLDHEHCLVYSFGTGSGSFESGMARLGCNVYTFDPHMSSRTDRRSGERTWRIGLHLSGNDSARIPGDRVMSLAEVMRSMGHRGQRVDYMRLDLDGDEWAALKKELANPGALSLVQQLGIQAAVEVIELPDSQRLSRLTMIYQVLVAIEHSGLRLVSARPQAEEHACHELPELTDKRVVCDYYDLLFVRKY